MQPVTNRIASLDGLRGIAILGVLAWHFFASVPRPRMEGIGRVAEHFASFGWMGVPLFFVLSGFLIGRILIRHRGTERHLRIFYLRRGCRILPLYIALLLFVGFLVPRDHGIQGPWSPGYTASIPIWSYAVFLQNIFMAKAAALGSSWLTVTWSLAVEEQFYLLLPIAVCSVNPKRLPFLLLGGIGLCWLYRAFANVQGMHVYVSMLTLPGRMDGLLIGVLAAWAWENNAARSCLRRNHRMALLAGIAAGAIVVGFQLGMLPSILRPLYAIWGFSLLSIFFSGLLLTTLSNTAGWIERALSLRAFGFCGSISYFVYLFHQPVNYLVHGFARDDAPSIADLSGCIATACSIVVVGAVGWLSMRYFEGPILRWGRSFSYTQPSNEAAHDHSAWRTCTQSSSD